MACDPASDQNKTKNNANTTNDESMCEEIDIGKPEISKCFKIMRMTEEEIKENPVKYNPFVVKYIYLDYFYSFIFVFFLVCF